MKIFHQNLNYPCDECDFVATNTSDLKMHKERHKKMGKSNTMAHEYENREIFLTRVEQVYFSWIMYFDFIIR